MSIRGNQGHVAPGLYPPSRFPREPVMPAWGRGGGGGAPSLSSCEDRLGAPAPWCRSPRDLRTPSASCTAPAPCSQRGLRVFPRIRLGTFLSPFSPPGGQHGCTTPPSSALTPGPSSPRCPTASPRHPRRQPALAPSTEQGLAGKGNRSACRLTRAEER